MDDDCGVAYLRANSIDGANVVHPMSIPTTTFYICLCSSLEYA